MKFNVSDFLREGYGAVREYEIDEDVRVDGAARRLTGDVRFDRTPEGVLVRARLHGGAEAECSRCLKPLQLPVDVTFEEQYIPKLDPATGSRVEPPEGEEDAYRIDERHMLDLSDAIQQYWSMSLPMAPVCGEDCRGICPDCGAVRDSGHECSDDASDDRWSKLRDLKLG